MLLLISLASAESYSRSYLRDMKRQEDKKFHDQLIYDGVQRIRDLIVLKAKEGHTHTTIPYPGCNELVRNDPKITVQNCEYIVKKIKNEIIYKFPDTSIKYNEQEKQYTIDWS